MGGALATKASTFELVATEDGEDFRLRAPG
jgi:hypothetical protein